MGSSGCRAEPRPAADGLQRLLLPRIIVALFFPRVRLSPGYCWPTSCKVLGVLFLGDVSSAFLPSKKACWVHQFRHLGVSQQYPPVCSTVHSVCLLPRKMCPKTYEKNQCQIARRGGSFWTVREQESVTPAHGGRKCTIVQPSRRRLEARTGV
jgi:hypothetical protein